jgi:precorrin-2 dehydrogenase / sirohydrochlorin ferrochelatase
MKPVNLFPAFLKIAGRPCLVVGAGAVGEEKIQGLLRVEASVTVVAPKATARVQAWARHRKIRWEKRKFRGSDLSGVFLVVAATSSPKLHDRLYKAARRKKVLCNVVDDPEHCDFYYGSVVKRGGLQIAISSAGQSPALAQRLRKKLEQQFGPEYEAWLEELGKAREKLFSREIEPSRRKELLHRLASESSFEQFRRRQRTRSRTPAKK